MYKGIPVLMKPKQNRNVKLEYGKEVAERMLQNACITYRHIEIWGQLGMLSGALPCIHKERKSTKNVHNTDDRNTKTHSGHIYTAIPNDF